MGTLYHRGTQSRSDFYASGTSHNCVEAEYDESMAMRSPALPAMTPRWSRILLAVATTVMGWAMPGQSTLATPLLETVSGTGCYGYGDNQTPALAKRAALALAQEQAVRTHRVFVQSSSTVKNLRLEDDIITTASSGMLEQIHIDKQEQKGQEICVSITAKISPAKFDDVIQQKATAKQIADAAQVPLLTEGSSFDLQLWTNKPAGEVYIEGEELEISVRSNRDAFLKVDYYQADGTVVHLVPNLFVDDAFVQANKTYTFGGRHTRSGFRITGPFGAETIKAVASTRPLDALSASEKPVEESQSYLKNFHAQMRGAKVVANPNQPAQWAEAAFGLTTVSKGALEQSQLLSGMREKQ